MQDLTGKLGKFRYLSVFKREMVKGEPKKLCETQYQNNLTDAELEHAMPILFSNFDCCIGKKCSIYTLMLFMFHHEIHSSHIFNIYLILSTYILSQKAKYFFGFGGI